MSGLRYWNLSIFKENMNICSVNLLCVSCTLVLETPIKFIRAQWSEYSMLVAQRNVTQTLNNDETFCWSWGGGIQSSKSEQCGNLLYCFDVYISTHFQPYQKQCLNSYVENNTIFWNSGDKFRYRKWLKNRLSQYSTNNNYLFMFKVYFLRYLQYLQ